MKRALCCMWLVWMALVLPAQGQPVLSPAAGSVAASGAGGGAHGWAVVAEPRGGGFLLLHLPPRDGAAMEGMRASEAGTARVAARLETAPEALAAVGDRVYVVFRSTLERGRTQRLVASLLVLPSGIGDLWRYEPRGRMRAEPSLPGDGSLVGFAGTPVGVAALIDRGPREMGVAVEGGDAGVEGEVGRAGRGSPVVGLRVLFGGEWREVGLPAEASGGATEGGAVLRRYMLASWDGGVAVLATRPARLATVWRARLTPERMREPESVRRAALDAQIAEWEHAGRPGGREPTAREIPLGSVEPSWEGEHLEWPAATGQGWVLPTGPLALLGSRVVFGHAMQEGGEGGVLLFASSGAGSERLGSVGDAVPAADAAVGMRRAVSAGVVVMGAARRVVVVLAPAGEAGDRRASVMDAAMDVRLVEISTDTGAVLYDGALRTGAPIGRDQVQALLVVVMGVTGLLLVWSVRGAGRERAVVLPPGSAMGEPTARLMAALVDFVVACVVTGWALGLPLLDVLVLRVSVGGDESPLGFVMGIAVLLGVGAGIGTVMEGLFGRSAGKAIVGLRVVAVSGTGSGTWRGPGLARALVRNVVRWGLAPIAVMGLTSGGDGRHWGDRLTGTAVVMRVEEAADGGEDEGQGG